MIIFEQLIKDEFPETDLDKIVELFSKHELKIHVINAIRLINTRLKVDNEKIKKSGTIQIYHIASSLLITINTKLRGLTASKKQKQKEELEYYLGHLLKRLLICVASKIPQKHKITFIENIYRTLEETCELNDYNFDQLMKILRIEEEAIKNVAEQGADSIITLAPECFKSIPSFIWNGHTDDAFEKFIDIVVDLKITSDGEKLKKLFEDPIENVAIDLNTTKPDYVLQFFVFLSTSTLVTFSGCGGFYQVLQIHVKNFDEIFLKKKLLFRRTAGVKKLKTWTINQKKFNLALKELFK